MSNYMEALRYTFFQQQLRRKFGKKLALEWTPPQREFDLLFVVLGSKSFSYHTDSKNMVFDDSVFGWEGKSMRVTTFYFQNIASQPVNLKLRRRDGRAGECKVALGPHGVHQQELFNQLNLEHCAEVVGNPPHNFRRCTFTARSTMPLQKSGLERLQHIHPSLRVLGSTRMAYNVIARSLWEPFQTGDQGHPGRDFSMASITPQDDTQLVFLPPPETKKTPCGLAPLPQFHKIKFLEDHVSFRFPLRKGHFPFYPMEHREKLVQHSESLREVLCSSEGASLLVQVSKRLPIEYQGSSVPFGPCPRNPLDVSQGFASIGKSIIETSEICGHFGLHNSNEASPPWNYQLPRLNCILLSKRYKSQLETVEDRRSPAAEVDNIRNGSPRLGFDIYLSGGNSVEVGAAGPTVDTPINTQDGTTGVSMTMPKRLSVEQQMNRSFFEASMEGRTLPVFFASQNLPRGDRLCSQNRREMCVYGGMYRLHPVQGCFPVTASALKAKLQQVEKVALPGLDPTQVKHLTFLRALHLRCFLEPVDLQLGIPADNSC